MGVAVSSVLGSLWSRTLDHCYFCPPLLKIYIILSEICHLPNLFFPLNTKIKKKGKAQILKLLLRTET